jgi:hypothetical protein
MGKMAWIPLGMQGVISVRESIQDSPVLPILAVISLITTGTTERKATARTGLAFVVSHPCRDEAAPWMGHPVLRLGGKNKNLGGILSFVVRTDGKALETLCVEVEDYG